MQLNQDEFEHLSPDDYSNNDPFSTSDDLESYSPTEDPFLKYSQDPPALIAVMGVTGSGKTTFVNEASGSCLKVGDDLDSCTSSIQVSEEFVLDGRRVVLVDTPGFDDTCKSDTDVLKSIAAFLGESYSAGGKLAGVIYVHRISDPRFGNLAAKNFRMFRELCGEKTLKNIVLMTNMWGQVTPQQGADRERQLKDKHFKAAIEKGARLCRHTNTPESARAILGTILKNRPVVLKIQRELVDEQKDIERTGAGKELSREICKVMVKYQSNIKELEEGIRQGAAEDEDGESRDEMEEEKRRLEEEAERLRKDLEDMKSKFEEARREMERRVKARIGEQLKRMKEEHEEEIQRYEKMVKELERDAQGNAVRIKSVRKIIEELRKRVEEELREKASRWKCIVM